MHNAWKVAKWEIKRNLKNKTFVIGLFISPLLLLLFYFIGSLFSDSNESEQMTVYVNDQMEVFSEFENIVDQQGLDWQIEATDVSQAELDEIEEDNTAYLFIFEEAIQSGFVPMHLSEDIDPAFIGQVQSLSAPLQAMRATDSGLSNQEAEQLLQPVVFIDETTADANEDSEAMADTLQQIVPGIFAGVIMLSIVFTGMAIFQSASQEKKDKIAEIILSSLTPSELMQGKIIGYFVLGLIQVVVFIGIILPVAVWQLDIPLLEYIFVPETILLVFIALLSYLMFAAIFVGIGATMADVTTAGNFQGMVMMLPFIPFILAGPVISDPNGIVATVSTYIPFTSPGVLLLRLTFLEEWPWIEIIIALAILIVSIVIFMKLAGKIFQVGILMYGKNATPKEIWKWIRA
ncbi:ABC transporter permease [Oceanobacillus sp. 1P07AA]|uniref:ABC transporter permease n=1 Tax=Oceanobacillus sp. 1P07AA TaxID=3132293 RepID=UPI0039A4F37A